jgi:peroxiredoxin
MTALKPRLTFPMLKPGDPIPPFDLPALLDGRSGRPTLAGIRSELVVLFFYPRDFSFICLIEVSGFGKALSSLAAEKTSVLRVRVDEVESHRRWAAELGGAASPCWPTREENSPRLRGVR